MTRFENRLPTGPGSRGGRWHDPEFRRLYHRAWRQAHPDYRERERVRSARRRGHQFPADVGVAAFLPDPAAFCGCVCGCSELVVVVCGFCRRDLHSESRRKVTRMPP